MRPSLSAFALFVACTLPTTALAQTLTMTIASINGRSIGSGVAAFAPASDCGGDVIITATGGPQFDIWRGSVGSMCNVAATRSSTTNTTCRHVAHVSSIASNQYTVNMTDLVKSATDGGESLCKVQDAAGQGTTYEYTVIQTNTDGDVATSEPYGKFTIRVDNQRPLPPTIEEENVTRVGESVSLVYTAPTGEAEQIAAKAYVDSSGSCEDGTPTSTRLVPGMQPPEGLTAVDGSASLTPTNTGVSLGSSVVVGIASVDIAGNIGNLSSLVCVRFVETIGFCTADDAECNQNCAVRAPGRRGAAPVMMLSALASLALVVHARRRRSAK